MKIGMLIFPDMTQLDFTGPYEVFAQLPGSQVHVIAKSLEPVAAIGGLRFLPDTAMDDTPQLDLLFVAGGPGVGALMEDRATLEFLRRQAEQARYVTAVCTGALVLGAAGLLKGYRATTHWLSMELLPLFGAEAVADRVVIDRNRITGGGVTAGIDFARGDTVAVIDSDLQDPPEVIVQMVEAWRQGSDVVYGVRSDREGETAIKLITASLFYRLLGRVTNIHIPQNVGDFRLMSRRVVDQLKLLREKDRFVRGLVSWVGFKQTGVTYHRDRRHAGETKYPFRKMVKFAFDGITSFSTLPLKIATWMGYLAAFLAILYLASVFVQKALGYTVDGWATIMVAMLFMGSVQLICLGILGEYLGRIFNEVKPRPMYVIETHVSARHGGSLPSRR